MRHSRTLSLLITASLALTTQSFNVTSKPQKAGTMPLQTQQRTCVSMTTSEEAEDTTTPCAPDRPDLVSEKSFIAAVEAIEREIAKVEGVEYVKIEDSKVQYAIGRIKASLPLPPGIDLIETPELVLINGVSQVAIDSGIKALDTIVGVSVEGTDFNESTLAMNMDNMA